MRHVKHCLVSKKSALVIFLDIVGAFDNVTFRSFVAAQRGLGMSEILTTWIENLLRHRTVQVKLYGDKVKREVVKGNPQGGILSLFLWNCVLNSLLLELRSRQGRNYHRCRRCGAPGPRSKGAPARSPLLQ